MLTVGSKYAKMSADEITKQYQTSRPLTDVASIREHLEVLREYIAKTGGLFGSRRSLQMDSCKLDAIADAIERIGNVKLAENIRSYGLTSATDDKRFVTTGAVYAWLQRLQSGSAKQAKPKSRTPKAKLGGGSGGEPDSTPKRSGRPPRTSYVNKHGILMQ